MPRRLVRPFWLAAAAVVVASLGVLAQNAPQPDLSGTWVLNPAKSRPAKSVVMGPKTIAIECAGQRIRITYVTGSKQSDHTFVADGKDHIDREIAGGGVLYSRAQWKKLCYPRRWGRV